MLDKPELGGVYQGKVSGIMEFGCFVEVEGFRQKVEGLVHVSNITTARASSAKGLVERGQQARLLMAGRGSRDPGGGQGGARQVWVKVVSVSGQRVGLSMRDVDQKTGKDLLAIDPVKAAAAGGRPVSGLQGISGIKVNPDDFVETVKRRGKKLTEMEKWEYKQLAQAGVLDVREHPLFDEEPVIACLDCIG
ncbi:ATP-dependent RNA helicase DHX8/PRP22 [Monoraphidium neglectum]|uniref:ATP-dependent RNA helicase DHX8/PRP22 n=1 Tax=Monoraphidium neglectum TaxID=145388 RepID=A0A0D2MIR7_9CHLO|nr:ATP-dependent RNA helicase DHX8/PRP22 [Monoraphidium neglectum]KIY94900.1 ATP-dependent RNA helicase DHX8/PRP22 [Monoraphidium neglectum]|eukprot:XP_013893920.1 ATP-dependent RNA helicase DHX8/PRP22 [Monoraphidium neglectum]